MSGLDGLIDARSKQISRIVGETAYTPVEGTGRSTRQTTLGEKALSVLGLPEEILTKAIGTVLTDNRKYDLSEGIGNYHNQTGFADLFRSAGLGHGEAAILGIAAAIANPLDPLNKLKVFAPTKLGKAAEVVATAGDNLVKEADGLWRISPKAILDDIARKEKGLAEGIYNDDVAKLVKRSIDDSRNSLKHSEELNSVLLEVQKRGVDLKSLKLAGTTYDRVLQGQMHLLGFGSAKSLGHIPGFNPANDVSVFGLGGKGTAALIKSTSGLKNKIVKPLSDSAYKLADYIGIPTARTEKAKSLSSNIQKILDNSSAKVEEVQRDLLSTYKTFLDEYGPEGLEAGKSDLLAVLQALEARHSGAKEMAISELSKLDDYTPSLPRGKGVAIGQGEGLTDEQKLKLSQTGLSDSEIPVAVAQFDTANSPSIRLGKHKQHEARLLGQYVVVKTSDAKVAESKLDDLDGIYGNRVWAKLDRLDGTFILQRRHPGAARIVKTSDFEPTHLRNLEAIAAQLSSKQKGFTAIGPEDILVSPSGAVQIINPSVITDFKSQKAAVANSRASLDYLADTLSVPRGSAREFPFLKNVKTARSVPKGVSGLSFRVPNAIAAGEDLIYVPAYDLLEQALNTEGHRQFVRSAYDNNKVTTIDAAFHNTEEFEAANNIAFHRGNIRKSVEKGLDPNIEPISVTTDDLGNLYVASGRDRLTAAILEGYEMVPVYRKNFIGDVINAEKGFYTGKTVRLADLWSPSFNSSSLGLFQSTRGIVAPNYSLVSRSGDIVKPQASQLILNPTINTALNRFVTLGPQFVGRARGQRIESIGAILTENFGSTRNGLLRIAEIAEQSEDLKSFVSNVEKLLVNRNTGKGILLDNTLRHVDAEALFNQIKNASSVNLDDLARAGVITEGSIGNERRLLLASDASDGLVVQVLDENTNTLRVYGNQLTTAHLKTSAESFINRTTTASEVEPYAKIQLIGADGTVNLEVKDLVKGQHPKLTDVMEPKKVFTISKEYKAALKSQGILVADSEKSFGEIKTHFQDKYYPKSEEGKSIGVLLKQQDRAAKSTKTGTFVEGRTTSTIVRPEFSFFVTRSGAVVIGTKQRNVSDILAKVFEEGPAYFEEFGIMTTGKIVVSNPFGGKMAKIGVGEIRNLEDRIRELATKFRDLGFSDGTVLDIRVPFDDAVWRSMYGERVTVGDILDAKFKITIPEQLKGFVPDIRILAPGKLGADAKEVGVVGLEKTRLANEKMQALFKKLEDIGDRLFLEQAKAGLPISYYSSWFGRHLTNAAKEALNKVWLANPDKQSKTFKHLESFFKGRVLTDFTTLEINNIIKRLKKEGIENAESIISDVVKSFRKGYVINPTAESAKTLIALSKILPEGIDFFHLDPIWATSMSVVGAQRAISRKQIVDSIKELGVAVWNGSIKELNTIKQIKNPEYLKLESKIADLGNQLTEAQLKLERLGTSSPELAGNVTEASIKQEIDSLTEKLAKAIESRAAFTDKVGKGKVLDTMVDLEAEHVWIRGEDTTRLIDEGIINATDIIGDPADVFVRLPVKKYSSVLDENKAEVFLFPKEVAGVVQKYFQTTSREGFNKFLAVTDTVQSLWRNWTLFPIPSYHVRNIISNSFMAYLGGVTDPGVYQKAMSIMKIISSHRTGQFTADQVVEALSAIAIPTVNGQVITGKQLWDEFFRHGGLAGGLHKSEFNRLGNMVRASEFERASVKAGLRPSSELAGSFLSDNAVLRAGVSVASSIENNFRMAAFMDALIKGHTEVKNGVVITGFEAAALNFKKIFYDYSDLSAFERSWLRRVIPFYSWSRHNIPRMLQTLATDPIKHYRMAEFFHSVETGATDGDPVNPNEIPEWLEGRYGIIVSKTKEGNYVVKTGDGFLPMIDAYKILAGEGIFKLIKDGITPFIKVPIEQLTNYSLYSEKKIEAYPGQVSSSFSLGNLGFSRRATTEGPLGVLNLILNESVFKTFFRPGGELASKVIDPIFDGKEGPSIKLGVFALLVGKAYEVNPAQARAAIYKNWSTRESQVTSLRNQALEQGDMKSVEGADRMLTWLRLQYPGNREN